MGVEQKKNLHPIVEEALKLAHKGIAPFEFDDYAVEQLGDLLRERFGKPDLLKAVVDLINLARLLDDQGSHSASTKLMIVVSTAAEFLGKNVNSKD